MPASLVGNGPTPTLRGATLREANWGGHATGEFSRTRLGHRPATDGPATALASRLAICGVLLVGGCGTSVESDPDAGSDAATDAEGDADPNAPRLVVGTGFSAYEPVDDGDEVRIIEGTQGGFHIWGGFVATNISPRGVEIEFDASVAGREIGRVSYVDDLVFEDDAPVEPGEGYEYAGVSVFLAADVDPMAVSGSRVTLTGRVQDATGVVVTDSVEVIAVCCAF